MNCFSVRGASRDRKDDHRKDRWGAKIAKETPSMGRATRGAPTACLCDPCASAISAIELSLRPPPPLRPATRCPLDHSNSIGSGGRPRRISKMYELAEWWPLPHGYLHSRACCPET